MLSCIFDWKWCQKSLEEVEYGKDVLTPVRFIIQGSGLTQSVVFSSFGSLWHRPEFSSRFLKWLSQCVLRLGINFGKSPLSGGM